MSVPCGSSRPSSVRAPLRGLVPSPGRSAAASAPSMLSRAERLFTGPADMSQNDICLFYNSITLLIHTRSLVCSKPQIALHSSAVCLASLSVWRVSALSFPNVVLNVPLTESHPLDFRSGFFNLINFLWTPAHSKHGVTGRKAAANKPKSAV